MELQLNISKNAKSGAYWFGSSTGTGMAYEINLNPVPTGLKIGMLIYMKAHAKNFGSATVKVNSVQKIILEK
jgi:hypothetical protein